ncbi:CD151 antigen-like isoform X1 [Lepeophtheirus salmonis]|uniref:CD151 antigen-like isoform X1 n=1 Tax=Lepeophtheirus salmonis TaxID=72036 RepID=UPI001AE12020|nr:tetraspanin-9-like [Lepeophtheirus salmonis]
MNKNHPMSKFEYDACGSCYKTTFIIANVGFMICALVLFGLGLWLTLESNILSSLYGSGSFYTFSAVSALIVGLILLFLSISGIVGAVQEIGPLLAVYSATLIILFIITLIGGILGMVFRTQLVKNLKSDMIQSLKDYDPSNEGEPVTIAWDTIQSKYECCGLSLNTNQDPRIIWKRNKKLNSGAADYKLPLSCCPASNYNTNDNTRASQTGPNSCSISKSWTKDCFILEFLSTRRNYLILGIVVIIIGSFMIVGITGSIVLARIALET